MKNMRIIGSKLEERANSLGLSAEEASKRLGCTLLQYCELIRGLMMPTHELLSYFAQCLAMPMEELLDGETGYYEESFVHAMGEFTIQEEREKILDIIEDYIRLRAAAGQ